MSQRQEGTTSPTAREWWELLITPAISTVVVAVVAAGLLAAAAMVVVRRGDPVYRSSTIVELHQKGVFSSSDPNVISTLELLRLKYSGLVKIVPVLVPAAEQLGIPPGELASSVRVDVPGRGLIFFISGTAGSPDDATRVANAVSQSLAAYADGEQADDGVPKNRRVVLRIIQSASPGIKISPDEDRATSIGLITGGVMLVVLYVVIQVVRAGPPGRQRRNVARQA